MKGWIKLHRQIKEWEWYNDSDVKSVFLHLILEANHNPKKWKGVLIERGQVITGRKKLSEELGISEQSIRTCLKKLEKSQNITSKTTNKFSLITVLNYDFYQESNQQTNQQSTNNQPTTNQQLTTNKNDKNERMKENKINHDFENFRKSYPGTKLGYQKEWENFLKHKDWESSISLLEPALEKEKKFREKKKKKNEFVAEWKHLKTWINNRCWEQEFPEEKENQTKILQFSAR